MTKETQFEKRTWVKGDRPGASDFNRIESGIESAHEQINQLQLVSANNQAVNHQAIEMLRSTDPVVLTENAEDLIERVKLIPKLETNAKVADVVQAFNTLHDALTGATDENQGDGAD